MCILDDFFIIDAVFPALDHSLCLTLWFFA